MVVRMSLTLIYFIRVGEEIVELTLSTSRGNDKGSSLERLRNVFSVLSKIFYSRKKIEEMVSFDNIMKLTTLLSVMKNILNGYCRSLL